ncbi:putative HAT dimerization domain, ribonuclease H-like superfamily [Arabidopsis thaliana]
MKHHLAGVKGNTDACLKISADIRFKIVNALKEAENKKKQNIVLDDTNLDGPEIEDVDGDDIRVDVRPSQKRKKQGIDLHDYFKRGVHDQTQPSIKACMQSKERIHAVDMSVALWFYDACIPMNAVNSPLFQPMMSMVASMGHGYVGPSYHALRVGLLRDAKLQVSLIIDKFKSSWASTGCTLMADGWKDTRQRPLINFLVYCPKGITFLKSVDASDIYASAENLCNLFAELVGIIGSENIVHFVTDSAPNYKAAGKLLVEKFPTIAWSPCSAHCINLILEDVAKLPHVHHIVRRMSKVTIFVYNHKPALNWVRKRSGWREIIRPGETRFATTFIALQSLYQHKEDLQALVTSADPELKQLFKTSKAKVAKSVILDERMWNDCLIIVKVMTPIIRLLRICDADEKPSLPYVYEGMYRARLGIKNIFQEKETLYKPYTNIIDRRWDRMLRHDLHAAAYYLNPAFMYDQPTFCEKPEVMSGLMNLFEKQKNDSKTKLFQELRVYREREGSFSLDMALTCSKTSQPDEWWRYFGHDAPNLQKMAIRILSQTASSSGCERNWCVFERIHTKKRNRLEHQRLNDLVFVHYNLRLQHRSKRKRSYDPVDYESIDKTEFWVVEEEEAGELEYDELENALAEEYPKDLEDTNPETSNDFDEDFTLPPEEDVWNDEEDNRD